MRDDFDDDYYATDEDAGTGVRGRFTQRLSTWAGAGLALVLIFGVSVWVYNLGQRDASAVPVIRASLEPAKIQPDDPGGAEIPHQDITSYTAGGASSGGAAATDRALPKITLAPPPARPAEADVAMGPLQAEAAEQAAQADEPAPEQGATEQGATEQATDTPTPEETDPVVAALDTPETAPPAPPIDATLQAPAISPVARSRPGNLAEKMAVARQSVSEEDELAAKAAASIVQIQLGAFPDRAMTQSEWGRIYRSNEDILSGRALVVQSTISGGRRFFRLRAGPFRDRVEAQNVCRALQSRGQDCIVAVNG